MANLEDRLAASALSQIIPGQRLGNPRPGALAHLGTGVIRLKRYLLLPQNIAGGGRQVFPQLA